MKNETDFIPSFTYTLQSKLVLTIDLSETIRLTDVTGALFVWLVMKTVSDASHNPTSIGLNQI